MDAETRAELARLRREMHELITERTRNIPSRWAAPPIALQVIQIIGGQLIEDNAVIQYEADDPDPMPYYDPDTDTEYVSGIGNGWLMGPSGTFDRRVLVRHDFAGRQAPLEGGWTYLVRGTTTLTVSSGDHANETMVAYLVTYPA